MKVKKIKILCFIGARGGSKGIPGKNIRLFNGKPLIAHTIEQALDLKDYIDKVIVSTDSFGIATIAKKYGAEVPFLRPKELAEDRSNIGDAIVYTIRRLEKEEKYKPDYILLLQPTAPLREREDIIKCIKLIQNKKCDSVITVCPTNYLFFNLDSKNKLSVANDPESKIRVKLNRQSVRPIYTYNGLAYISERGVFLKHKTFLTDNTYAVVCDAWRSVDLDNIEDWILAEFLYKNKKILTHKIKTDNHG
ncbi:MAG TPA: acylneuraminate cytidylyltransferase family protein [Candidatus Paceibacterota bacterium]